MKASIIMALIGWLVAWGLDALLLFGLESSGLNKVSIKAATAAGLVALPLVLFLHIDMIRQMRRHSVDEFLKVIVMINADMFGFLVGLCILISIVLIAEGESANEDGGGGGGGDERGGGDE